MSILNKPDLANPVHLLAFGLGAGLSPKAPGTVGTLVGVLFYWLLQDVEIGVYLGVLALVCLSGVWICEQTAKDLNTHDHPGIVWDEIAGYLLTMVAAPVGWQWMLVGFLLFRFLMY